MAKSAVLPVLIGGGLLVGGILAYKAISQTDDTSGFVSGVTGQYIDEPSQKVIRTDLRQDAKTDRVVSRQDAGVSKVAIRQDAGVSKVAIRQDARTDRTSIRQQATANIVPAAAKVASTAVSAVRTYNQAAIQVSKAPVKTIRTILSNLRNK